MAVEGQAYQAAPRVWKSSTVGAMWSVSNDSRAFIMPRAGKEDANEFNVDFEENTRIISTRR